MLGTFLLWFGWYGFNAGSSVDFFSVDQSLNIPVIALTFVNSTLAGSMGGIVSLFINLIVEENRTGEPLWKLSGAMNGCLAGIVAITGSCALVEPWAAMIIGSIAGALYYLCSHLLVKYCIDDAVDAIPVHLAGGIWGVIATGLFCCPTNLKYWYKLSDESLVAHPGLFYSWARGSGDFSLMACQLAGLAFILCWTTTIMTPFFFMLSYMGLFRSNALEEIVGLDVSYHGYTPRSLAGEVTNGQLREYSAASGSRRFKYDLGLDVNEETDKEGIDRFE